MPWCPVTSKGSSHQPEKSLAALILAATESTFYLLLLGVLATESTCYFFVYLHWFQFWPPGGATCISYKFGHQVAPLALPWIALLVISVGFELVSSSARVTSVKSHEPLGVC